LFKSPKILCLKAQPYVGALRTGTLEMKCGKKVEMPISCALMIIRSLGNGQQITTSNNISIFKQRDKFKIIVSSSKQRAGDVYLN
jgi:hypothetical protein